MQINIYIQTSKSLLVLGAELGEAARRTTEEPSTLLAAYKS